MILKKRFYKTTASLILLIGLTGCDQVDELKNKYEEQLSSDNIQRPEKPVKDEIYYAGTVKYIDGSVMGVTRAEHQINGGFNIYDIGTAAVLGFITMDGSVNNIGGRSMGICQGATVTDNGLQGECTVPVKNPIIAQEEQIRLYKEQTQDATPAPSLPNCPDHRNGDFNPEYSPEVCNANGYFWCSIQKKCTDQTININECLANQ